MRRGTEVILRGTVDSIRNRPDGSTIYVVFDGEKVGRVLLMPDDVMALAVGESSNYRKPGYGTLGKKS
jgi:hypothetical protein